MITENYSCARNTILFAVLATGVAAVFWHPFWRALELAFHRSEYTHLLLVLPVSLILIIKDRCHIFKVMSSRVGPSAGLGVIGLVLILPAGAIPGCHLTFEILALVTLWWAVFVLCFGYPAFSAAGFQVFFSFLFVPFPESLVNVVVEFLQKGSVFVAYHLLQLTSIPIARDGFLLSMPGLSIEVASECSGIRSSLLLFVTSIVIAHLFLQQTWKKALIALLVLPVAILKNGVRIFVLSFWAVFVSPTILSSWIHHNGGFIFFLLGLSLVIFSVWLLRTRPAKAMFVSSPSHASVAQP